MSNYERTEEGVIDFNQFKKKKEAEEVEPLFTEPMIIELGDEENTEKFLLLVNLVRDSVQYLALESMADSDSGIAIVEAIVEDGKFAGVQAVQSEEDYKEIADIVRSALESAHGKGDESDNN